ncbi:hypothetical protein C8Q75DRAFT_749198 [Abortiporus biennis]|nr:hypothetical protein C8Q75DRAFT_749198 [Abortiporus biennis]
MLMVRPRKVAWVVIVGREPGIYDDWLKAAPQVANCPGALHRGYYTNIDARRAWDYAVEHGDVYRVELDENEGRVGVCQRAVAPQNPPDGDANGNNDHLGGGGGNNNPPGPGADGNNAVPPDARQDNGAAAGQNRNNGTRSTNSAPQASTSSQGGQQVSSNSAQNLSPVSRQSSHAAQKARVRPIRQGVPVTSTPQGQRTLTARSHHSSPSSSPPTGITIEDELLNLSLDGRGTDRRSNDSPPRTPQTSARGRPGSRASSTENSIQTSSSPPTMITQIEGSRSSNACTSSSPPTLVTQNEGSVRTCSLPATPRQHTSQVQGRILSPLRRDANATPSATSPGMAIQSLPQPPPPSIYSVLDHSSQSPQIREIMERWTPKASVAHTEPASTESSYFPSPSNYPWLNPGGGLRSPFMTPTPRSSAIGGTSQQRSGSVHNSPTTGMNAGSSNSSSYLTASQDQSQTQTSNSSSPNVGSLVSSTYIRASTIPTPMAASSTIAPYASSEASLNTPSGGGNVIGTSSRSLTKTYANAQVQTERSYLITRERKMKKQAKMRSQNATSSHSSPSSFSVVSPRQQQHHHIHACATCHRPFTPSVSSPRGQTSGSSQPQPQNQQTPTEEERMDTSMMHMDVDSESNIPTRPNTPDEAQSHTLVEAIIEDRDSNHNTQTTFIQDSSTGSVANGGILRTNSLGLTSMHVRNSSLISPPSSSSRTLVAAVGSARTSATDFVDPRSPLSRSASLPVNAASFGRPSPRIESDAHASISALIIR